MRWLICLSLFALMAGSAFAANSRPLQQRYCAGMLQEKYVPFGGRADCLNDKYAIEVEWVKDWYQAVGQSLYYAAATKKKPAIILLCPYRASNVPRRGKVPQLYLSSRRGPDTGQNSGHGMGVFPGGQSSQRLHQAGCVATVVRSWAHEGAANLRHGERLSSIQGDLRADGVLAMVLAVIWFFLKK